MSRESALKQSFTIQEIVAEELRRLGTLGYSWALTGGATEDDGATLHVTIELETRYAVRDAALARPPVADDEARLRAALEAATTELATCAGFFERAGSMGTVASIRRTLATIAEALAASGTAPHPFLPRSGSQDQSGVYRHCSVNGCDLAPDQHVHATEPAP